MKGYTSGILFFTVIMTVIFLPRHLPALEIPFLATGSVNPEFREGSMLFTGDIMLGRAVERNMEKNGTSFPFEGIARLLESVDVAVGNFEAAIPTVHKPTPDFNFALSVKREYAKVLKDAGFDVLSLANNHTHDFGLSGLTNTRKVLKQADILTVGDPKNDPAFLTEVVTIGSTKIGILALHTVAGTPRAEVLSNAMKTLKENSDAQVVYVHWGIEYEHTHRAEEAALAHTFIDLGADAVIGHHPHVVQDVEIYNGKPIFYSLGNLIFDQYFSDDVQEGLILKLDTAPRTLSFTLIPVSSKETRNAPQLMNVAEKEAFLAKVASWSPEGGYTGDAVIVTSF